MALRSLAWCLGAAVALFGGSPWAQVHSALAPENEVPLRPTTWLYFTLKKKAPAMSVTVSPCDLPIEWSLAARTLKDKPHKSLQCE
ncbi:hypothetical protein EYF80_020142 [Liparis tanakae]|uniref:Uncharacterized protein n=1 Tax=Liparis tanakae TaxID=230148 RepID=A0A4Z2HXK3_9TELE|nr:hypothetical protein EYF80_020142 [Liparis tanakae]